MIEPKGPANQAGAQEPERTVQLNVRVSVSLMDRLTYAVYLRGRKRLAPATKGGITIEALDEWLKKNGFDKPL